ncbi:MAG: PAS domain S-box protein [Thermodesulfobacteriota bacterium]
MGESQEFLQAALDALSSHIAVLDAHGRILAVNAAWRRLAGSSGCAADYEIGRSYLLLCERGGLGPPPGESRAAAEGVRSVAEGRAERFVMDYRCRAPDEERCFQMTVTRFAGPGPVRVVVAHEDVTARRQAEERLRRSDERYRAFLEHSSEAIWRFELSAPLAVTLDADAQIDAFYRDAYLAECNDAMARMYGHERAEDLVGEPLGKLLPREDPANVAYLRRFIGSGYRLTDAESHEVDREGRPRHFLNNLIGIVDEGRLLRAWGTQRDVTERKQTELALRDSERKLRLALDAAGLAIWELHRDGGRTLSDNYPSVVGAAPPTGRDFLAMVHPEDREEMLARIAQAMRERGAYRHEYRVLLPDGRERWLAAHGRVVPGEEGAPSRMMGVVMNVTARRRAEEQREEARRSMQLALEIARAGVWEWDVAADRVIGDENLARILGLPADEVVAGRLPADAFLDAVHPDDRDRVDRGYRRLLETGGEFEVEYRVVLPGRATRWLAARGRVMLDAGHRVVNVTGLVLDITAQKEVELDAAFLAELSEQIRRSDDPRALLEEVPRLVREHLGASRCLIAEAGADGAWRVHADPPQPADAPEDPERRASAAAFFAAPGAVAELLHAGCVVAVSDTRDDARTSDHAARYEPLGIRALVVVPQLRERRWTFTLAATCDVPRAWTPRELTLLETVGERTWNAVEKLRLDARLRESEQRYRSLVSATTAIVSVADGAGRFVAPQPAWQAYTGQSWEEHGGFGYLAAIHPGDREAAARAWEDARRRRAIFEYEARLRHAPSRAYRYCVARVVPVFDDDGSVREWVSSIADVDERRRAERRAERARAEAERANAAKDAFLATLSHELRAPLQGALGWVTLLRAGGLAPDQQAKALATLERSVRHQSQLVNDLLDVSRIISGKLSLEPSPVDLALVLEQLRDELQVDARSKHIALEVRSPSDGVTVLGDAERLAQVFRNLLANALKFTPPRGRVTLACELNDDRVAVTVTDTGRGIAPEFLPYVFDRFSQADSNITREHGGLGLGLGIVRHLVEAHGGAVVAESAGPGCGATFRVTLPIVPASLSLLPSVRRPVVADAAKKLAAIRVYLVEDDADTREVVAVLLAQAGAEVTAASGARAAVELLVGATPDVIVTDLGMPGEDGFWLAQRVRAAGIDVPIVALTGFADAEMKARVLAHGFQAHLAKPIDPDLLIAEIRSLVGRVG